MAVTVSTAKPASPERAWWRNPLRLAAAAAVVFLAVYGSDLAFQAQPGLVVNGLHGPDGTPYRPWAYVPLASPAGPAVQAEHGVPISEGTREPAGLEDNDLWQRVSRVRREMAVDLDGVMHDGIPAVSLRDLLPHMGAQMQWAGAGPATLFTSSGVAVLRPGETHAERNYHRVSLPEPPVVSGHDLLLPLEAAAALLGGEVSQDPATGLFSLAWQDQRLRILMEDEAFHINISRSGRWLQVYYAGTFVKHYRVCSGEGENTPVGDFRIENRSVWPAWRAYWGEVIPGASPRNPLGARFMGTTARGRRTGWSIGIHGTNQPSSIGRRISGGCIRLLNPHIIELYNVIPIGTRVSIRETF